MGALQWLNSQGSLVFSQFSVDEFLIFHSYYTASVETLPIHTRFEPQRGQDAERKRSGNAFAGVFLERQPCGTAHAVLDESWRV